MKRGVVIIIVLAAIAVLFIIPFNREKTVTINASFFKVYKQLVGPRNWVKWQPELKQDWDADSTKISFITKPDGYSVNSPSTAINVKEAASNFVIKQEGLSGDHTYSFTAIPDKNTRKTQLAIVLKTNLAGYITGFFTGKAFEKTGINEFKNYLENDNLYYGYNIHRILVGSPNLIEIKKLVPAAIQFQVADSSYARLARFAVENNLVKTQPLIAQFIPLLGTDSVQVNVGFFVDKTIKSTGDIISIEMPPAGFLWVAEYEGTFKDRQKAYAALNRYFTDHLFQSAVLPFESYLDNKLPKSDTSKVKLRINFTSFD